MLKNKFNLMKNEKVEESKDLIKIKRLKKKEVANTPKQILICCWFKKKDNSVKKEEKD